MKKVFELEAILSKMENYNEVGNIGNILSQSINFLDDI